jgi:hypothetical protein
MHASKKQGGKKEILNFGFCTPNQENAKHKRLMKNLRFRETF